MRIALLGGGAISLTLARKLAAGHLPGIDVVGLASRRPTERTALIQELVGGCPFSEDPARLLDQDPEVILEAAHPDLIREHGMAFVSAGTSLVVMSSTSFREPAFFTGMWDAAKTAGAQVVIPSGALGGLDLLRTVSRLGEVDDVLVDLIKDPATWPSTPYDTDETDDAGRRVLFKGTAVEAMERYPTHLNMTATVSMAGIGPERTRVAVHADPRMSDIVHSLELSGGFGSARIDCHVAGNPDKPRGSYISALSGIEAVRGLRDAIRVGT